MENADKKAYPQNNTALTSAPEYGGLTKRERFAMAAMQGILAGDVEQQFDSTQVDVAVEFADALLKELEETATEKDKDND